jgi:predicted RNA-binding protein YlxR (DUF448 family)
VGCGRSLSKAELLRLARAADGRLRLDRDGRIQGRGAYVCRRSECADRIAAGGALARSLRGSVAIDSETLDSIREWQRSEFTR